jgi:hypothetical protein
LFDRHARFSSTLFLTLASLQSSKIVLGLGVSFKIATLACALLAVCGPAWAQDSVGHALRPRVVADLANENIFDAGVANLTVRTAFTPSPSLSKPQLFGLLMLMSVPRESAAAARNSLHGAKP